MSSPYSSFVAEASVEDRSAFLIKTYLHVFAAVIGFVALEAFLFASGVADLVLPALANSGRAGWAVVLVAFMGASWVAEKCASSDAGPAVQYAGLSLYVAAESLIFLPMIAYAAYVGGADLLLQAAAITLVMFACLTGIVFVTRKDFSFMRGILMIGSVAALGLFGASMLFGFSLGVAFSWAMVALMSGYILYHTSNVMLHYRPNQYVAASLALFASLATLFWYVLRILSARRD